MARKKRAGCGIGLLFWIIIFMVVIIMLLQNKSPFKKIKIIKEFNKVKNYIMKKQPSILKKKTNIELFFVRHIQKTDQLSLVKVKRTINSTGTPLKHTMNLLLNGPSQEEEKKGIISVFWSGTQLKSVKILKNVAYLDFNANIETGVGISMLQARLYQIVYTATQFPEVTKVRILINGKRKSTFSIEGLSIKNPLGRLKKPVF